MAIPHKTTVSLAVLAVVAVHIIVAGCNRDEWQYDGDFHKVIEQADRVVVRDGGYTCCGPVDKQAILLNITNRREIDELNRIVEFEPHQTSDACMCCGYPGIDWYRGQKRVALTALHHGLALRWKKFPGDAQLTPRSSQAIVEWLAKRGITRPLEEVEERNRRIAVGKEARTLLAEHVPAEILEAVSAARAEVQAKVPLDGTAAFDARARLADARIRETIGDLPTMYAAFFRMLGCLPMHWNARLADEQDTAYDFLIRAPREELDEAIRAALQSAARSERQGAARLIFSQLFMTRHGKTRGDIEGWMELLADEAYEDPFPENRRLVLHRLVEHPSVRAAHVLHSAITDPDQTVRRYAIETFALNDSPESREILARIAEGQSQPRESRNPPRNYAEGTSIVYHVPGMNERVFEDTDQEAATKALQAMRR